MTTVQILEKLILQIHANPSLLSQLPWDDLCLCIQSEFQDRKSLYTDSQFQTLLEELNQCFLTLQQAKTNYDSPTTIQILSQFSFALTVMPSIDHTFQRYERMNYLNARLNHYEKDTTIILGDSHVNFFSGNEQLTFLPIGNNINTCPQVADYPFTILHLGPCLAYHSNTPNTTYSFKEKVDELLLNFIKPQGKIIVSLGEIDIRVHVFPQAQKQNRPYTQILDTILAEYMSFLCWLKNQGYHVGCWGPIASQKDNCPLDPAFPRNGSEQERNLATEYFNQHLAAQCKENGITYFSIFSEMITENYETIEDYLSPDRCHLGQAAMSLAADFMESL